MLQKLLISNFLYNNSKSWTVGACNKEHNSSPSNFGHELINHLLFEHILYFWRIASQLPTLPLGCSCIQKSSSLLLNNTWSNANTGKGLDEMCWRVNYCVLGAQEDKMSDQYRFRPSQCEKPSRSPGLWQAERQGYCLLASVWWI